MTRPSIPSLRKSIIPPPASPDFPISELRQVAVYCLEPSERRKRYEARVKLEPAVHFMHHSQVKHFVEATIKLHYLEGNPHTGKCLDNLWEIRESRLETEAVAFWWSSLSLGVKSAVDSSGKKDGAKLNQMRSSVRLWAHPDLVAEEIRDELRESA